MINTVDWKRIRQVVCARSRRGFRILWDEAVHVVKAGKQQHHERKSNAMHYS
jgi:hypothetical protein